MDYTQIKQKERSVKCDHGPDDQFFQHDGIVAGNSCADFAFSLFREESHNALCLVRGKSFSYPRLNGVLQLTNSDGLKPGKKCTRYDSGSAAVIFSSPKKSSEFSAEFTGENHHGTRRPPPVARQALFRLPSDRPV